HSMAARLRSWPKRLVLHEKDFIVDHKRISVADREAFERDPVTLIRIFHLAQQHGLDFHPDAMRLATRQLKLIDKAVREDEEANRLFLDILTAKNDTEVVLRRMNEVGVLGRFIPDFGRIVSMMQFNM